MGNYTVPLSQRGAAYAQIIDDVVPDPPTQVPMRMKKRAMYEAKRGEYEFAKFFAIRAVPFNLRKEVTAQLAAAEALLFGCVVSPTHPSMRYGNNPRR